MATFEIEANGAKYQIDAPDENAAMSAFQSMGLAPAPDPAPAASTETPAPPVQRMDPASVDPTLGPVFAPGQTPIMPAAPTNPTGQQLAVAAPGGGPSPVGDESAAVGRGLINGVPVVGPYLLGGLNRAAATVRSLQNGTTFPQELQNVQRFSDQTAAQNPISTTFGEVGGGIIGTAPLIAAAPAAFGAGAGGLVARSAASAGTGVLLGGADSAVRSGGDLTEARNGALLGGVFGGAAPGVGSLIGRGVGALVGRAAERATPVPGLGNAAADMAGQDLQASGGRQAVIDQLQHLGPDAMLLDASPSFQGLAQGLAVEPQTRQVITTPITARNRGTNDRLIEALNGAAGPAENPTALRQTLTDAQQVLTDPLFARSDAAAIPRSPVMDELAARPVIATGLRKAGEIAHNEGSPLASVTLDEAGNVLPSGAAEAFAAGSRGRISGALSQLLRHGSALKEADQILATRAQESAPLYERARAAEINYDTPEGQKLLELLPRVLPEAKSEAAKIMQLEGSAPGGRWVGGPEPVEAAASGLGPSARQPAPVSLARHIARNGGINLDGGDAAHLGLDTWAIPFNGRVARPGGRSIDSFWRENLIEKGYLPPDTDGGMSRDVRGEVLNLLAEERAGRPTYPLNTDPRARGVDPALAAHEADLIDGAKADILKSALQKGLDPREINPDVLDSAAHSHAANGGVDPYAAYQEALASGRATGAADATAPERQFQPNVATWDYYKRGLDRVIAGDRDPLTSRVGSLGRAAQGLKNEILDSLDTAVPEFREARQVYSDQSSMLDALNRGREAVRKGRPGEEIRRDLGDLTDAEADVYRLGAGHELRGKLAKASDKADLPHVVFGNQATRDQIAALAPSPDAYKRFSGAVQNEAQQFTEAVQPDARAWRNAYDTATAKAKALGDTAEGRAASRAAMDLRTQLSNNPDFAAAVARHDEYGRLLGALDTGTKVLDTDKNAIHPSVLADILAGSSPAEAAAIRTGTRGQLDQIVGTHSNDLVALRQKVMSDGDWNRDKLAQVFGDEQAKKIFNAVDRESAFREAYTKIVEGSQTAQRSAAAARVAPREISMGGSGGSGIAVAGLLGGHAGAGAAAGLKGITLAQSMAARASDIARNEQLARILTMGPSPELDALIHALDRRGGAKAGVARVGAGTDRLVQALLQSQGDRSRRMLPSLVRGQ